MTWRQLTDMKTTDQAKRSSGKGPRKLNARKRLDMADKRATVELLGSFTSDDLGEVGDSLVGS